MLLAKSVSKDYCLNMNTDGKREFEYKDCDFIPLKRTSITVRGVQTLRNKNESEFPSCRSRKKNIRGN